MQIKIQPALRADHRHRFQAILGEVAQGIGYVDGGGTMMSGESCDIFIYPLEGFSEGDLRLRLTGRREKPPWKLPSVDAGPKDQDHRDPITD